MENLYETYMNIPVVTRLYNTACIITTLLVQLDVLSPFNLYFSRTLVFKHYQLWRLLTNFLYLGTFSFSFLFNLIFTNRYCRMLEEGSFRGRTADFIVMFLFGGVWMIAISTYLNVLFLGQAFTIMLVYVWSRRNPMIRVNFFGILNFQAPNLPWVILGFSVLLGSPILTDLVGMVVGHLYYFLEDVFPHQPGGFRIIRTPKFLKKICDSEPDDPNYNPIPEERPGGYEWGNPNADQH